MRTNSIISRGESLTILKNQLRKAALEKRAAELKDANQEQREVILTEIEREVEKKVHKHEWTYGFGDVVH